MRASWVRSTCAAATDATADCLRRSLLVRALNEFLFHATPVLVTASTFVSYVLLGNVLTAEVAFVSLVLFNHIKMPLSLAPTTVSRVIDSRVSLARIQALLLAEEVDAQAVDRAEHAPCSVAFTHCSLAWTRDAPPVLHALDLHLQPGELVAIGTLHTDARC